MCFQYAKELFVLPIIAFLGFLQKSSKGYIFLKKIRKSKKGKIMILDSNFNIKQDKQITFLNVHLRQPPFSSWPKGLKDPSVRGLTTGWSEGRQIAL